MAWSLQRYLIFAILCCIPGTFTWQCIGCTPVRCHPLFCFNSNMACPSEIEFQASMMRQLCTHLPLCKDPPPCIKNFARVLRLGPNGIHWLVPTCVQKESGQYTSQIQA